MLDKFLTWDVETLFLTNKCIQITSQWLAIKRSLSTTIHFKTPAPMASSEWIIRMQKSHVTWKQLLSIFFFDLVSCQEADMVIVDLR